MNNIKTAIELIIKSAITGEKQVLPQNIDMEALAHQLKRHGITAIGYQGLVNCGADKNHPVMKQLMQQYIKIMFTSERQLAEKDKLLAAFEANGIDYLPLKGCNMKQLYPKPEFRIMGDADILIHEIDYPAIIKIMKDNAFAETPGADHTFNWKNSNLYVELHRRLVPVDDKDYLAYFGDGWQRAQLSSGHCYKYSPEDEFIFIFTHFARHFRFGGIGYRQLTDIWVYMTAHPQLDWDYIYSEMDKLQLKEFFDNTIKTVRCCFEDDPQDTATDIISNFVFSIGNWCSMSSYTISQNIRYRESGYNKNMGVKSHMLVTSFFPSLQYMKRQFKVLEKHPVLLPVMWVVRWAAIILTRRKNIGRKFKSISNVNEQVVDQRRQLLDSIGLGYNFE